jgi:hypothetical protein
VTQGHVWEMEEGPPYTAWERWKCARCGQFRASYGKPDPLPDSPECEETIVEEVQES